MITGVWIDMRALPTRTLTIVPLLTVLAACAGTSDLYPSLAMRPFESGVSPAAPEPPPASIRPVTPAARVAELLGAAAASDAAFRAQEANAARLARAASGQRFESAAHAAALVALADLDAKRGATAGTLAALDGLAADAATALSPDPALFAAQGEVAALVERQDRTIAQLWAALGS